MMFNLQYTIDRYYKEVVMENILNKKESGWKSLRSGEMESIMNFSNNYIKFLNRSKTEREANKSILLELENNGFEVQVKLMGMGKYKFIQDMFMEKLEEAL